MALQSASYAVHEVTVMPMHPITTFMFKRVIRVIDGVCMLHRRLEPLHACGHTGLHQ